MFYSSPILPAWPKQRQILQMIALIPTHLVAVNYENSMIKHLNRSEFHIRTNIVKCILPAVQLSVHPPKTNKVHLSWRSDSTPTTALKEETMGH